MTTCPPLAVLLGAGLVGFCPTSQLPPQPNRVQDGAIRQPAPDGVEGRPRFDVRGAVVDGRGRPSALATVVLINNERDPPVDWVNPQRHAQALVTITDFDGGFVFRDVPATTYWLWAGDADGRAHARRIGFHDDAPPPVVLRLTHTVLEGEIVWDDGHTPVARAEIAVYDEAFVTLTGESGRFRIPGIPAGEYTVIAKARIPLTEAERRAIYDLVEAGYAEAARGRAREGMVRRMEEVAVQSEVAVEENRTARLRFVLPGGVIEGIVTTPGGEAVVSARIFGGSRSSFPFGGDVRRSFTDGDGQFTLTHVPAGRCTVQVVGLNHEIRRVAVDVEAGDRPAHVEITLYAFRPQVVFHFTDADGRPLAGRSLRRAYNDGSVQGIGGLKTDNDGSWRDHWMVSGTRHYLVGRPTVGWGEQTVVVEPGVPETHCHVRLARGATVTGTVRERASGDPIGGVVLRPHRLDADGEYDQTSQWNWLFHCIHCRLVSGYPITQVSRDGDGTYRLSNLPPGEYRIATRRLSITGTEAIEHFDIEVDDLLEKRWVRGRALVGEGEPLGRAELTVIRDGQRPSAPPLGPMDGVPRRVLTDDAGRFRLGPFTPGEYWLTAEIPGRRSLTGKVDLTEGSLDAGDFLLRDSAFTLAAD